MDHHQVKRFYRYPDASYSYNGGNEITRHPHQGAPTTIRHDQAPTMSIEVMAAWLDTMEYANGI